MELPCKWEKIPQLDIKYYEVNNPIPRMGYILLSHWTKGPHIWPQTLKAIANLMGNSLQPDKARFLKTLPPYTPEYIEIKLEASPQLTNIHSSGRFYILYQRRKVFISLTQLQTL